VADGLKSFDRVADCYDATRALPPDAEAAVAEGIMHALREVSAVPNVLEVGIGTGRIAVPLTRAGARVVGVDIASAMLARLRAKGPDIAVVLGEATQLPFRGHVFDGVLFVHLLHLLADASAALRAATEAVRPGGMLLYARTDYAHTQHRLVIARARELVRGLAGVDLGSGDWHREADRAFAEHGSASGARMAETVLARWQERTTGREVLGALAGRVYSSTWAIPEAVMPELLRQLTPWTEAQLGGLDQVIENEATITLVMAHLPG
jgi:SAM-dependent methyltransferase